MLKITEEKTETEKYQEGLRTFFITTGNLYRLEYISEKIPSKRNYTKLINFALDKALTPYVDKFSKAKTPEEIDKIILKVMREVEQYGEKEPKFSK